MYHLYALPGIVVNVLLSSCLCHSNPSCNTCLSCDLLWLPGPFLQNCYSVNCSSFCISAGNHLLPLCNSIIHLTLMNSIFQNQDNWNLNQSSNIFQPLSLSLSPSVQLTVTQNGYRPRIESCWQKLIHTFSTEFFQ